MSSTTTPRSNREAASYFSCITACEACLVACRACPDKLAADPAEPTISELLLCVQLCEMALHAMSTRAVVAPDACNVCARSCEKVAHLFMLLPQAEPRRCARACYRAALECRKIAALRLREPAARRERSARRTLRPQPTRELQPA